MATISFRIAYPIILAGLFIIVVFIALNYQTLNTSFYVVLFLLVAYIFLFGFATGQSFAAPVKKLLQRADDLSKGNLKSRFYSESKDELGELGAAFNKIAEEFEQSRSQAETLERSVDIKVKARTQSLEETINALEQKVKNRTAELQKIVEDAEKTKQEATLKDEESANLKTKMKDVAEAKSEEKTEAKNPKKDVAKKDVAEDEGGA